MKKKTQSKNSNYSLAHVLYQKLGNDWYAFTEVDGDCFMTKVEDEEALAAQQNTQASDDSFPRRRKPQPVPMQKP